MLERIEASQRAYDASRIVVVALRARRRRSGARPRLRFSWSIVGPLTGSRAAAPGRRRRVRRARRVVEPRRAGRARRRRQPHQRGAGQPLPADRGAGAGTAAKHSSSRPRPARCSTSSAARPPSCSGAGHDRRHRRPPLPRRLGVLEARVDGGITWPPPARPTRSSSVRRAEPGRSRAGKIAGRTALEGGPCTSPTCSRTRSSPGLRRRRRDGATVLGVPLLRGDAVIGVIVLARTSQAVHGRADRAGHDLRRPGRHRDRERAPVRRGAGAHARAEPLGRGAAGAGRGQPGGQLDARAAGGAARDRRPCGGACRGGCRRVLRLRRERPGVPPPGDARARPGRGRGARPRRPVRLGEGAAGLAGLRRAAVQIPDIDQEPGYPLLRHRAEARLSRAARRAAVARGQPGRRARALPQGAGRLRRGDRRPGPDARQPVGARDPERRAVRGDRAARGASSRRPAGTSPSSSPT